VIVVDSSVALQWFVSEPQNGAAEELFGDDLAAPDIIFVEVANVLGKRVRAGEMPLAVAQESLEFLSTHITVIEPSRPLLQHALALSVALKHPVYDCTFLACAAKLGVTLITRDKPLWDRASRAGYGDKVTLLVEPQ
jgi:predicted nucleic acid-binding protein